MSETAYPELDHAQDIFKSLIYDNLVSLALNALFAYASFLNIPGIRQAITFIVTRFADFLFTGLKLVTDLTAIHLVNKIAEDQYARASVTLKIIARNKGIDSKEFKDARELAKIALAKFVSFGAV
jgi:hypothetical protein